MARVFQTGWETGSVTQNDLLQQGAMSTVTVPGTWSGYSFQGATGKTSLPTTYTELYAGFRYYHQSGFSAQPILTFASAADTAQVQIRVTAGGKITVTRGNNVATIGTGTAQLVVASWAYIETHVVINDATGSVEVKVNGTVDQTYTAVDTREDAGASTCDRLWFLGDNNQFIDDLYVNDTTGARNNAYSGDVRLSAYIPSSAGDVTGLTPTSGSNFQTVDERPPSDADYNSATGTTLYDLYNIPNTSGVATVQAVNLWLRCQKSDAGAKNVAHVLKYDTDASGTADTENVGSDLALSTSFIYHGKCYNDQPDATAWSAAKVDALQIGAKAR